MCAANWWPLVQGMMLMHRANLREATLHSASSGTATTRTTTTESVARPTSSRETDYALGPPPTLDHQTVSLIPTPRLYTKVRTSL